MRFQKLKELSERTIHTPQSIPHTKANDTNVQISNYSLATASLLETYLERKIRRKGNEKNI